MTRQPQSYFPVHLTTTIHTLNSLITAVLPSPGYNFSLYCNFEVDLYNDSFIDVLRVVIVYCGCKMDWAAAYWVALCN